MFFHAKHTSLLALGLVLVAVTACGGTEPEPTATLAPSVKLVNYSSYPTEDIEEWIALAESKMKSRKSRIFTFIYPVGEMKNPETRIRYFKNRCEGKINEC